MAFICEWREREKNRTEQWLSIVKNVGWFYQGLTPIHCCHSIISWMTTILFEMVKSVSFHLLNIELNFECIPHSPFKRRERNKNYTQWPYSIIVSHELWHKTWYVTRIRFTKQVRFCFCTFAHFVWHLNDSKKSISLPALSFAFK